MRVRMFSSTARAALAAPAMISARLLVESGTDPKEAIPRVRAARPGAIETHAQEVWVKTGPRNGYPEA